MMHEQGRKVILYASEENEAPCDELVTCVTMKQQRNWFGDHDENDLDRGGFTWEPRDPWWVEFNARVIGEVAKRMSPTDLLLPLAGEAHQIVVDALPQLIVAEYGVGYEGVLRRRVRGASPFFAAFESHSHRHLVYGKWGWQNVHHNGRAYDVVIPNYFDPDELPQGDGSGGYLLFVGRLIWNKGAHVAAEIADALGLKLIVAGPGATEWGDNYVRYKEGEARGHDLEYVGAVGVEERAELMGGAIATIMPTMYVEPFGGVAVESMMCGTPVVTTDFGAFTETVAHGVSGFRFQTLQEAVDATRATVFLDRDKVREHALRHYSLEAVRPAYEHWFDNLDGIWDGGWTKLRDPVHA